MIAFELYLFMIAFLNFPVVVILSIWSKTQLAGDTWNVGQYGAVAMASEASLSASILR